MCTADVCSGALCICTVALIKKKICGQTCFGGLRGKMAVYTK